MSRYYIETNDKKLLCHTRNHVYIGELNNYDKGYENFRNMVTKGSDDNRFESKVKITKLDETYCYNIETIRGYIKTIINIADDTFKILDVVYDSEVIDKLYVISYDVCLTDKNIQRIINYTESESIVVTFCDCKIYSTFTDCDYLRDLDYAYLNQLVFDAIFTRCSMCQTQVGLNESIMTICNKDDKVLDFIPPNSIIYPIKLFDFNITRMAPNVNFFIYHGVTYVILPIPRNMSIHKITNGLSLCIDRFGHVFEISTYDNMPYINTGSLVVIRKYGTAISPLVDTFDFTDIEYVKDCVQIFALSERPFILDHGIIVEYESLDELKKELHINKLCVSDNKLRN